MERAELAARLAEAGAAERAALLERHAALADGELAGALEALFDDTKGSDLKRATGASTALTALAGVTADPKVSALAAWIAGKVALQIDGRMEAAIAHLEDAEARFTALGQSRTVAATQVSKLHALAMLGRYDEAIACGLRARDVLVAHGDTLTAGKIEQNLGNIYWRRDRYPEAEKYLRMARERYVGLGDQTQLAQIDNNLATVLSLQYKFRDAALRYEQALARAEAAGLEVTRAEIECNLGSLELHQGHYDRALDYLERSRRRYALLEMPHKAAVTEQDLADAYLELNLIPEAAAIYARVIPTFADLGMRAEQARALAYYGQALLLLSQMDAARAALAEAQRLYAAEGNAVGTAMVTLTEAQLSYAAGRYATAARGAARSEAVFRSAGTRGRVLLARWLRGEALRASGKFQEARRILESTLHDAELQAMPQVAQRCVTSLGLLAMALGDGEAAEAHFKQAVALIEDLRAPLLAEEFRTAFVADKLTPYAKLVRLCLDEGGAERVAEALGYVERARSRALVDMLSGALPMQLGGKPRDDFEAGLLARLEGLREELNWFYSQINRLPNGETARGTGAMGELHEAVREREAGVQEITRQLQQHGENPFTRVETIEIARLQQDLGLDTALVEYFSLDGEWLAFAVTNEGVEVFRSLGSEEEVQAALAQLRFQVDTLRYGADRLHVHLDRLTLRARHYAAILYDLLLRPLEARLGARRLVVVPHRALHYLPFHALHDGAGYVIERREVCYAPSASVLRYCLDQPRRPLRQPLLLGVPDARIPRVRDEVLALARLFPDAVTLLDEGATLVALPDRAATADVLHLACHGQFRPDNPLFSSLRLADGWMTVRDTYGLDLRCGLVALSACETGLSAVAPGDELIGLARGFFSAGAPALLVSLWTVDDASTAQLMTAFYTGLRSGERPATALRQAQCRLLQEYPHPFFWSPFVLLGRW